MPKRVKKGLKPTLKSWECSHGCDVTTSICKHLEKHLPQMSAGLVPHTRSDVSEVEESNIFNYGHESEEDFVAGLKKFGIYQEWDLQLLVAYFYDNYSLREILATQHYQSKETLRLRIKTLLGQLKERGYGKDKVRGT